MPHDNGIRNQHAKFPDGTELELITATEARDVLTTTYVRYLASGDGPAFARRCVFARNDKEMVCVSLAEKENE